MNKNSISRRDFLKLLAAIPVSMAIEPLTKYISTPDESQKHVIVMIYDAWTARNTSLYGYARNTTPNLEKFAQKAIVYHRHYSAGNFTVPGTASLLTGAYPWKHRALSLGGQISPEYAQKQMFNVLSDSFSTIGFAQNKNADLLLYQAGKALQTHISGSEFNLTKRLAYNLPVFKNDPYVAFSSLDDNILLQGIGYDGSMFLGPAIRSLDLRQQLLNQFSQKGNYYKDRLPDNTEQFLLSSVIDGVINLLKNLTTPSLIYLHFYPPHEPYRPTKEFFDAFDNSHETLIRKPIHFLSDSKQSFTSLKSRNILYDKFLASWDAETARLYEFIDQSGLREKSFIFLTSDHGDMFERGVVGHSTPLLNQPVVHIPLIVSYPGCTQRTDVHIATNNIDILPTITHLTGKATPEWVDGQILPGFGAQGDPNRSIYTFEAKENANFGKFTKYSFALNKNNKRLLYYHYDNYKEFEFYDLDTDPEEMNNLYPAQSADVKIMEQELLQKVAEISAPIPK